MKKCPYCAEDIQDEAIVCRFCQRDLPAVAVPPSPESLVFCTQCNARQPFGAGKCDNCGYRLPESPANTGTSASSNSSLGKWLIASGFLGALYFFAIFDTSIETPTGDRVHNLGLLSTQQNGVVISLLVAVVGAILLARRPNK